MDAVLCGDVRQGLVRIICCRGQMVGVQESHCVSLASLAQVADQADNEQCDYDGDDNYDADDQTRTAILFVGHCIVFDVQLLLRHHLFNLTHRAGRVLFDYSE